MKKLKLEIPLILPEVPDEKDQCVQELISLLQEQKGLEKVHVSEAAENGDHSRGRNRCFNNTV